MHRLFLLILLLPLPLASQVKILMPVVVKDAAGKPVTDLKTSDFQVSGPKNVSIERIWLVPPDMLSKDDPRPSLVVLYDAVNATNPYPDVRKNWLREFLETVATNHMPVTLYVNTEQGLRLIYDAATPPETLAAALKLTGNPKALGSDPRTEQQAEKLDLLLTASRSRTFRAYDKHLNQMKSLIDLARVLQTSDKRKLVIWLADDTYFPGFTKSPKFWTGETLPMFEAMVEELNAAHVSVYPDLFGFRGFTNDTQAEYWFYEQAQLAQSTGGLNFTNDSIWETARAALADFGPYYMLAVAVPTPNKTDWIPLNIEVHRPGVVVRSAEGFFGLKPVKTH